jgi:hypothetical protein
MLRSNAPTPRTTRKKAPKKMSKTEFIIIDSSAKMPSTCWGRYRRIGVLEIEAGARVSRIDARPRKVRRIVEIYDRLRYGATERSAYRIALAKAKALVSELEAESQELAELCDSRFESEGY